MACKVIIKLFSGGKLPHFSRKGDACLDCYAKEYHLLKKGERVQIPLGFGLELPEDYEALIRPRSGLSRKGIDVCLGTIDSNYRGELQATLINNSPVDYEVFEGDRVCQLAIRETPKITFVEREYLSETERGDNGWGSSGR